MPGARQQGIHKSRSGSVHNMVDALTDIGGVWGVDCSQGSPLVGVRGGGRGLLLGGEWGPHLEH